MYFFDILVHVCTHMYVRIIQFGGRFLATKVFVGKLLATGGPWMIFLGQANGGQ